MAGKHDHRLPMRTDGGENITGLHETCLAMSSREAAGLTQSSAFVPCEELPVGCDSAEVSWDRSDTPAALSKLNDPQRVVE